MSLLKTAKDIAALLAGEFFGRILIGIGITGIIGGFLIYIVVYNLALWFGIAQEKAYAGAFAITTLSYLLSVLSLVLGIYLMLWAKKKGL